jgi:hypothetical protein
VNIANPANILYFCLIHCTAKIANMAKPEAQISDRDIIQKLLAALQVLPHVHSKPPVWEPHSGEAHSKADAEIDLQVADKQFKLLVEVKKSIYPRDVRELLWTIRQLKNYAQASERGTVPLLAAESISPGAKELLESESVGYFDSGGSLYIPAPGAYLYIEKPPPKPFAKSVRALFKGKRSQVLHALLHQRNEWFGVKELAELAQVSSATASETLAALERFDWLASRGQGPSKERRLAEPGQLLDEWKKQVLAARELPVRRYYVPSAKSESLIHRVAQVCEAHNLEYVITQEAAAQLYAPFLSAISRVAYRVLPGRSAEAAARELDARVVAEGANLIVIETRSLGEFLFKERVDSVWLANAVQVYLDLLRAGGRAHEMAEHLRRERIGF